MSRPAATTCICVFLAAAMAARQAHANEIDKGYLVFEHNTLERMPSDYVPEHKTFVDKLTCELARGETNSVQFGVHATSGDLTNVRIAVTSDLDVTTYHRRTKFIAQAAPKPTEADLDKKVASPSDFMYLQRGDTVPKLVSNASVNFWLTIHAGAAAVPGQHVGKVRIEIDGKETTELDLAVNVYPFQLAPARIPFGMYYSRGQYNSHNASHDWIYRDMAAHSQNSVTFSNTRDFGEVDFTQVPLKDDHRMVKIINTAREAELVSSHIPCLLVASTLRYTYRDRVGLPQAELKAAIAWLAKEQREQGWPEIVVYGWDEPTIPAPGLRECYTPLRGLPIRLGTALSAAAAYAYGDIHDAWIVHDGHITPEMQAEAARRGAQVWTYTYRLWRQSYNPLIQRHYAGLYTWALRLKGNYVWEYYYGYNWIEPDSKETMPTTGWEARREGVDDYRYLQMVEDAINAKPDDPTAIEASVWLAKLRSRVASNFNRDLDDYWGSFPVATTRVDAHTVDAGKPFKTDEYDRIRATAAGYINTLGPAASPLPSPVMPLKDEAAAFRAKTVEQCAEGLRSSDTAIRRSAAMALFELRLHSDDVVDELIKALDDPDVRVPALMALETIGPEAIRASPKVAALLSHSDDFIRQGATFTLKGLTIVPKKVLVELPKMWAFRKDPEKAGESQQWFFTAENKDGPNWNKISTHDFWEEGYVGDGWYALDFTLPEANGKRTWIKFGAVDENYTLWINGQYIGDNTNAGTRFWNIPVEAEITGKFKPGESNHIVVRVNNSAQAGGIWKPVTLFVQQ